MVGRLPAKSVKLFSTKFGERTRKPEAECILTIGEKFMPFDFKKYKERKAKSENRDLAKELYGYSPAANELSEIEPCTGLFPHSVSGECCQRINMETGGKICKHGRDPVDCDYTLCRNVWGLCAKLGCQNVIEKVSDFKTVYCREHERSEDRRNAAIRFDQEKPMFHLLPWDAVGEVVKVFTFGAKKYGDHNWKKGFKYSRCLNSLLRHITAWASGENVDPESGLNHLAHAACNCLFLIYFQLHTSIGEDDR